MRGILAAIALLMFLAGPVAAKGTRSSTTRPSGLKGVIQSITRDSTGTVHITLTHRESGAAHELSFVADDNTRVLLKKAPATTTDLKPGQRVEVISDSLDDNAAATEIHITGQARRHLRRIR